jgi:hypothetical protein
MASPLAPDPINIEKPGAKETQQRDQYQHDRNIAHGFTHPFAAITSARLPVAI